MSRRGWALGGAALLLVAAVTAAVLALGHEDEPAAAADGPARAQTATVERGPLSAVVSQEGILAYRARPDGAPFPATNHARGTYTQLPAVGDAVACGEVLYRVDEQPVLLLCGAVPAYRALAQGDKGRDVRQLNRTLGVRGAGDTFTAATAAALARRQRSTGAKVTGTLALGDAVVLPGAARVAKVAGQLGGPAQPGARVLDATSDTLQVLVNLDPSERRQIHRGDRATITLPDTTTLRGRVVAFGRTAQAPAGPDATAADATIATSIRLDDPGAVRGLDRAPVGVEIATEGVDDALSVPVTALVGRAGGGFAVEVVRAGDRRELVDVDVGLFDTAAGRVQVEGALRAGDAVVVPSL